MKTFEQYNNIDEKEKLFLELTYLDDLEIKFDFIEYKEYIFYFYKDDYLFYQDKKNMKFYINYYKIWSVFESKFNINYEEIREFMKGMIDKHFNLKDYTPIANLHLPHKR